MKAQGIAALFIELKVIALGLFVLWLWVNNLNYAVKAAKPGGNLRLQVDQYLMMVARFGPGANGYWRIVYAQCMWYKGCSLKAPEFFIQLLGDGIIWH